MTPWRIMVIAGEASGDTLAAELVTALRGELLRPSTYSSDAQPRSSDLEPRFFGAGGSAMKASGVELAFDLTSHAVVGLAEVIRNYAKFRKFFNELMRMAVEREPHVIICVDFSKFNHQFAHAIKQHVRARRNRFNNWNPLVVKYISPQVWASRASRAYQMQDDLDLLLSIFPFEKEWYAKRTPRLRVEFVGHPMLDRYADSGGLVPPRNSASPIVALLPGSRRGELMHHLPVIVPAWSRIAKEFPNASAVMVLPNEELATVARSFLPASESSRVRIQIGGLGDVLRESSLAIASTGTVTMECARFRVPAVTLYKTSWFTYQVGRRIVTVKYLSMPNLLAGKEVFPEFIQGAATPANIADASLNLLTNEKLHGEAQAQLDGIVRSLGEPGASRRAARAIVELM